MKKLVLCLGVAASAIAAPAMARDGAVYIGLDAGAIFAEDTDITISQNVDAATLDFQTGWEASGQLGYDFGPIRAEVEGSYREFNPDTIGVTSTGLPSTPPNPNLIGQYDARGENTLISAMANAMLDFGADDEINFSIGAGAGYTWFEPFVRTIAQRNPTFLNESQDDKGLAWQAIAQVRVPVTDTFDVGLKYKYLDTHDYRFTDTLGRTVDFDMSGHSALISVLLNFGGRDPVPVAPPPPPRPVTPPPPPPPPPAPPRVTCNQGPYIVFFDWDQSDITPEAATVLNSAITAYSNCGTVPIMLAGYTDRSGTVQYNLGLAARRNNSVQQYLTGRGIPAARISSEAFGEANPRVPTADGVRELQNRRVEITYGPGSGM